MIIYSNLITAAELCELIGCINFQTRNFKQCSGGCAHIVPYFLGFNPSPMFPSVGSEVQPASGAQASPDQQPDPNMSLKTEYMSFPPPLQRTPLNNAHARYLENLLNIFFTLYGVPLNTLVHFSLSSHDEHKNSSWLTSPLNRPSDQGQLDSHESLSSLPDRVDPSTVTKSFRPGGKASAQASLASRDKTPKNRRRRGKNYNNTGKDIY